MAVAGIPLFMVACEPALSGYQHAADFFQGLVRITGAMLLPLTSASLLSHVIIGAAGEAMDLERLHREVGDAVAERLRSLSLNAGPAQSLDDVARELHEKLMLRNESTKQLHVESIYRDSEGEMMRLAPLVDSRGDAKLNRIWSLCQNRVITSKSGVRLRIWPPRAPISRR